MEGRSSNQNSNRLLVQIPVTRTGEFATLRRMTTRTRDAFALLVLALLPATTASGHRKDGPPHMIKPHRGMQMKVGPVDVPRGKEVTECTYFKFPHGHDLAVNRVKIKVQGGSHHIHIYRPTDSTLDVPDGHETCNMAVNFDVWELVLASQSQLLNWKLPSGIALHFKAHEQLLAQTHFVDNGLLSSPPEGWAVFNLYAIPPKKVTSYAGSLFGQDRDVVVPPHSISSATTRCVFPKPVKLLALTGHYHFRGIHFTANTWDGTTTGPLIYEQKGYLEPQFRRYAPDELGEVPGLEWTCTWDNETDQTFEFGPFTDQNEHCNLFAFYYPAVGTNEAMTCVQKDKQVTVTVRR